MYKRQISITGGGGSDHVFITPAVDGDLASLPSALQNTTLVGGAGNDELTVIGTLDLSHASNQVSGFETLNLLTGSPSAITLTGSQLTGFNTVNGTLVEGEDAADSTEITIADAGAGTQVDLTRGVASDMVFANVATLVVGDYITLQLTFDQFTSIGTVETSGQDSKAWIEYGDDAVLERDLDITQLTIHSGAPIPRIEIAAGYTLTLTTAQVGGAILFGEGAVRIISTAGATDLTALDLEDVSSDLNVTLVVTLPEGAEPGYVDLFGNQSVVTAIDAFEVAAGATLEIMSEQVSGKDVTGSGAVEVNLAVIFEPPAEEFEFDFSGISDDLTVTGYVAVTTTLHPDGDLGPMSEIRVHDGATLTLGANQADTLMINGEGDVIVRVADPDYACLLYTSPSPRD